MFLDQAQCEKLNVKLTEADDKNYYEYLRDIGCPLKPVWEE